jgi:murein L,D-transpeptidase YcbB/YkuD
MSVALYDHVGRPLPLSVVAALAVCILCGCSTSLRPEEWDGAVQQVLASRAAALRDPLAADVRKFYRQRHEASWVNVRGATKRARLAIDLLRTAPQHGISSETYDVDGLRRMADATRQGYAAAPDRVRRLAELDVGLTSALLTFARDVALGRREWRSAPGWNSQRPAPDFVRSLAESGVNDPVKWIETLQPRHAEYLALQRAHPRG